jgi:hypothetical protein
MVSSLQDIEALLLRLDQRCERVADTLLVPVAPNQPPVALQLREPVLVLQVEFGAIPETQEAQLRVFRSLLELNASELVHAAYAVVGDTIVLCAALELLSLDPNELQAVFSDFELALAEHVGLLRNKIEGKL